MVDILIVYCFPEEIDEILFTSTYACMLESLSTEKWIEDMFTFAVIYRVKSRINSFR